jgi:glycine dehydrogenase subunit 1
VSYIPHTTEDVATMLDAIGVKDLDTLFDEIPPALLAQGVDGVPPALSEMEVSRLMAERAACDGRPLNFIGAGAYEHHVPAPVWAIASRGEIYSAYTPYQAEASQGTLQTIYEFQTMIAALTGMPVANASLYDGASALAEACLMAVRANRQSQSARILMPRSVNPIYRKVVAAIVGNQKLQLDSVDFDPTSGQTAPAAFQQYEGQDVTALVVQQPNFFGVLEDVDALTDWARRHKMLVIAVVNPLSLAVLKPPGAWGGASSVGKGADIVCGEGQPLGVPLSSGGPYFGFMATRMEFVRQMPGRVVGRTLDVDGKPGFTLTLQAREQHIRRAKATSNICTNQGLVMTAATIYMSLLGSRGLESVALACMRRTRELVDTLTRIPGVQCALSGERFHEAVLRLDRPVAPVLGHLSRSGILGGFDLTSDYPELGRGLLVCATETKTVADLAAYAQSLAAGMAA